MLALWLWALPAAAEDPRLPEVALPAVRQWIQDRAPVLRVTARLHEAPALLQVDVSATTAEVRVLITPRPDDGQARGGTLLPTLLVLTDPRQPPPELQSVLADLTATLRKVDRTPAPAPKRAGPPGAPPTQGLLTVTWALLLLSVLALPWALWRSWQALDLPRNYAIALAFAPLAGWILRAAAPHHLVMVYFGWLHVDQAVDLQQLPRYGAATTLLDHALFQAFGTGHATVQWLHTGLGALTILPMAALAGALVVPPRARLWTMLGTAWALALLPLSILDHGTESMLVPAFLWWALAVVLLQRLVRVPSVPDAAAVVVLLGLCGLARPDCMLVALPTAVVLAIAAPGARLRANGPWLLAIALLTAAAWLPGLQWLRDRTAEDLAAGNLPHFGAAFLDHLPERFRHGWVVLDPRYFPFAGAVLPLVAVLFPAARRPALALGVVALAWAVPMLLDFNESSMLRLHAPSAMLWLAAGMVALGVLVATPLPRPLPPQTHWMTISLAIVQLAADGVATVGEVFALQLSNADQQLFDRVAVHSRDGKPATYVTRSYDDPPDRGVHLFQPAYALEPGDKWLSVRDFLRDEAAVRARGEVYAVQGARCHAGLNEQRKAWSYPRMHPACEALCAGGKCQPVWTKTVDNTGERGFDWYPPYAVAPTLTLGLYQR